MVLEKVTHLHYVDVLWIARQWPDKKKQKRVIGNGTGDKTGFIDVFRITGDLCQRVVYPDQDFVDIDAVGKFQFNIPASGNGPGNHALQAGNASQVFLLLDNNLLFHVLGSRSRPFRNNGHHPDVEIRDHLDGHAINGQDTEQADDQYRYRDNQGFLESKPEHGIKFLSADYADYRR